LISGDSLDACRYYSIDFGNVHEKQSICKNICDNRLTCLQSEIILKMKKKMVRIQICPINNSLFMPVSTRSPILKFFEKQGGKS